MNKKEKTIFSGFSILEALLSVFVIMIGMLGVITMLSSSIKGSLDSKNQIIASLLAEEGIELVRNIRDNNWISSGEESSFDRGLVSSNLNCNIDRRFNYSAGNSLTCGSGTIFRLFLDESTGAYTHDNSKTPTNFYRRISVSLNGANARTITSVVTWGESDFPSLSGLAQCNTEEKCTYSQVILNKWGE